MDESKNNTELLKGFKLFGVVKEVGVDDEGLTAFYKDYFTYPLYKDDGLVLYNDFFGNRSILKLSTYNPFKLYSGYKKMKNRMGEKKVGGEHGRGGFGTRRNRSL